MGQAESSHSEHRSRRHGFRRVSLGGLGRKRMSRSKNLSHVFTLSDDVLKVELLNLNTATEEELMTLPGINRTLAGNIVGHRLAIGRFHRVEDLALVSGIGAHKLELIRPEICVGNSGSGASSQASLSLDSLGNGGSLLDVNSASVFALQAIPGVNQKLAASVVERRHRRGPYRSLDELAKVLGMDKHRLALIRPYLRAEVDSDGSITPTPSNGKSSPAWNKPQAFSTPLANGINAIDGTPKGAFGNNGFSKAQAVPRMNGYRKSLELNSGISEEEIWELLSVASPRPLTPSDFVGRCEGRSSVRVATWNLDGFSVDKADNPGVREVVCRTILENRLSLLALQEVQCTEALTRITMELNTPILKRVRDWRENRRAWRSLHLGAGLAIVWDSDPKLGISLTQQPPTTTVLLPVAASAVFHINKFYVTIINVHVHTADDQKLVEGLCESENSLLLGDFTALNETVALDRAFTREKSTALQSDRIYYNDNVIWGKNSKASLSTGIGGIVRQGLTHLGIPQGWRWGGPASSHCPVWCQIFSQPSES